MIRPVRRDVICFRSVLKMSDKYVAIGCCFSFLAFVALIYSLAFNVWGFLPYHGNGETLNVSGVKCKFLDVPGINSPSLQSFIQATNTGEDQTSVLNGLAVYSNLTDACQPLGDVSKAKIQVHKVALVTLTNSNYKLCPFKNLIVSAQNAGYSVLIHFTDKPNNIRLTQEELSEDKILIPVLSVGSKDCINDRGIRTANELFLDQSDRAIVKIRIQIPQESFELDKMRSYLDNLFCWLFVGPIITLEWLRRTKKFCCMSGGQQVEEGRSVRNGTNETVRNMEEAPNGNEGTHLNSITETVDNHHGIDDEGQPSLIPMNSRARYVNCILNTLHHVVVGFCYVILIIAALPVGITCGGLSFFRFDERYARVLLPSVTLLLLWSPFQIFCFFMYSRFACKTTWTAQTNFSKLIRSDWFASNVYLLVLGMVVPVCHLLSFDLPNVSFYATYDTMCTISNGLFIIILNKHKFVTRYVFYISVCMIFAYLESDVVAVFYFALNSEGSLSNLKLTALRTAAIGLTLSVSFSSSMHIIRKLVKPEESLFEGLGEK